MSQAAPPAARLFQLAAFSTYVYTIYYSFSYVNVPPPYPEFAYAGKSKFLTQWNLCLCAAYFGLCVILSVVPLRRLYRVRDFIFCSISLPSCIFVSAVFWGLYAIDRELIFPKDFEAFYPVWINHCSHSLIVVTAVCEALFCHHTLPSNWASFTGVLLWFSIYQVWVLYLGIAKEVWVYPVMRILSPMGRTFLFIGLGVGVFALHTTCNYFLRAIGNCPQNERKQR